MSKIVDYINSAYDRSNAVYKSAGGNAANKAWAQSTINNTANALRFNADNMAARSAVAGGMSKEQLDYQKLQNGQAVGQAVGQIQAGASQQEMAIAQGRVQNIQNQANALVAEEQEKRRQRNALIGSVIQGASTLASSMI